MDGFPHRVLLEHVAKPICRIVVGAATLKCLCHPEQQPYMQLHQEAATLGAPALVPVLGQQLTAVSRECSLIRLKFPAAHRVPRQLLELVRVDHDVFGVEDEHGVRQAEIRRILSSRELGLQRVTGRMESLAEAIERGFRVHTRPEDVDDLLTVQGVPRVDC
jgi:hypothetical protein